MAKSIDEQRYGVQKGVNYYKRCQIAHKSSGQRCVICLAKSSQIHHASYGNDKVGVTIFPVCANCHTTVCHKSSNWIESTNKMESRNVREFTDYLRMRYLFVQVVHNPIHGQLMYKSTKKKSPASVTNRRRTVRKRD